MASPIIDYASPASRSSLRLPARSEIRWADFPDGLRVTQVLAGRDGALAALLLAAFTFLVMTLTVHGMLAKWQRFVGEIVLFAMMMGLELLVGALVINNTWRKTILTVRRDAMTLEMTAPFGGGRRFTFPAEQVADVCVVDRPPLPGEAVVPELEIRMWSIPPVQLFTGHPHGTLVAIAREIKRVQPVAPAPQPGVTTQSVNVVQPPKRTPE